MTYKPPDFTWQYLDKKILMEIATFNGRQRAWLFLQRQLFYVYVDEHGDGKRTRLNAYTERGDAHEHMQKWVYNKMEEEKP